MSFRFHFLNIKLSEYYSLLGNCNSLEFCNVYLAASLLFASPAIVAATSTAIVNKELKTFAVLSLFLSHKILNLSHALLIFVLILLFVVSF